MPLMKSASPITIARVPLRIPLGGGSTDLPSYYERFGGFIFSVAINLYMDVLVKRPRTDDHVHVLHKKAERVERSEDVEHDIVREALRMHGVENKISITFKSDTPAGTGLGSSGACAVAVHKGVAAFLGRNMSNLKAAEHSFHLTQNLGLPDGMQDPYACALGGFVVLHIDTRGRVKVERPKISPKTACIFFDNTLFLYTGVSRESKTILAAQDKKKVLELKHATKKIGKEILQAFKKGNLDAFGKCMDEHWRIKKQMSQGISNPTFDKIYETAKNAGALGGKIMGAGGGGYFMFYCPNKSIKAKIRTALRPFRMREIDLAIDTKGARTSAIVL